MKIELEEVKRIAELAHIRLTDDELPRMARELSVILDYIDQLSSIDSGTFIESAATSGTPMREDEARPSLPLDVVKSNAPAFVHGYFAVPRVIGGE